MVEMIVEGIGIDESKNTLVLLRDTQKNRFLPIWIGPAEAISIAMELEHREPPRPMTHDLMANILKEIGVGVDYVVVSDFREKTFYATIRLRCGDKTQDIDARPSDAIALALRTNASIFVRDDIADAVSIVMQEGEGQPESIGNPSPEEIARFMRLVEGVDLGSE
jgi:bifunctional DNase/RNase